mmetsp:Transcript_13860/g.22896  ORF Transcript_13860/g.22896 Transcript_13860/m.22896 type:complete len:95 (-) Transcript_13860:634-918(-)
MQIFIWIHVHGTLPLPIPLAVSPLEAEFVEDEGGDSPCKAGSTAVTNAVKPVPWLRPSEVNWTKAILDQAVTTVSPGSVPLIFPTTEPVGPPPS